MKIEIGATGKLIKGHLFDVGKSNLERQLKEYDNQLYLVWNPMKRQGYGCWEVRRRPNKKTLVHVAEFEGVNYYNLEYINLDVECHVMDSPVLGYHMLAKIQKMDAWKYKDFTKAVDDAEAAYNEKIQAKGAEDMRDMVKEYKSEIRDMRELIKSGLNPARILAKMGKAGS